MKIEPVSQGMWWITYLLGVNLLGQRDVVAKTRQAIVDAVKKTIKRCDELSKSVHVKGTMDWQIPLGIASCILSAIGSFTPGTKGVAAVGGVVLATAKDIQGDRKNSSQFKVSNYQNTMEALEKGLKQVNKSLKTAEEALVENFDRNTKAIQDTINRPYFDMRVLPLTSDQLDNRANDGTGADGHEVMEYNAGSARRIYHDLIPTIHRIVDTAIGQLQNDPTTTCPHGNVGIGPDGAKSSFTAFQDLVLNHLIEFRSDLQGAAENLELACKDIETTDQSIEQELNRFGNKINSDGSPYPEN
ncbi:MAG: hypothetical protein Q4D79_02280 [Propionibacteriaceae bacterium]|nr:hypothetical protein [Propionibacteriaceae bacterium]